MTGITLISSELGPKRLELLHEVVPTATMIAVLVNPNNPVSRKESRASGDGSPPRAADPSCQRWHQTEIESAFATLSNSGPPRLLSVSTPS